METDILFNLGVLGIVMTILGYTVARCTLSKALCLLQFQELFLIGAGVFGVVSGFKLAILPFQSQVIKSTLGFDRWVFIIGGYAVIEISLRQISENSVLVSRRNATRFKDN
jgi:hypothetical protein